MAASHFSRTYGFSGRHRPHPKAGQAAARPAVSDRLCHIGVFTYDPRHVEMGLVGRMGAICELGAFPPRPARLAALGTPLLISPLDCVSGQ